MDRRRSAWVGRLDPDVTAALRSQQRADSGYTRARKKFAADGVAGIECNGALAVGRGGGRVRAHEAAGGDRRYGEEATAADAVAQALRDPAAPAAHCIVKGDRLLAAQRDAAGVMVVEPVAHAR